MAPCTESKGCWKWLSLESGTQMERKKMFKTWPNSLRDLYLARVDMIALHFTEVTGKRPSQILVVEQQDNLDWLTMVIALCLCRSPWTAFNLMETSKRLHGARLPLAIIKSMSQSWFEIQVYSVWVMEEEDGIKPTLQKKNKAPLKTWTPLLVKRKLCRWFSGQTEQKLGFKLIKYLKMSTISTFIKLFLNL